MAYVALKRWDNGGGKITTPGDVVPDAHAWRGLRNWERRGWVRNVADAEIKNGRWVNWAAPPPIGGVAPKPEPAVEEDKTPGTLFEDLADCTKAVLVEIADELGVDYDSASKKAVIVEAIIAHDAEGAATLLKDYEEE